MKPESNEVDKFFEDLPSEDKKVADIFAPEESVPAKEDPKEKEKGGEEEPHKNRRHRRLEAQLAEEKEARIRAEERATTLSEAGRFSKENSVDLDDRLLRMYGSTPEGKEAARLHMEMLTEATQKGEENALRRLEERQAQEKAEQKRFESFIDTQLESIEDEFNVDITSDAPAARKARREFLEMVQELSPQDENGTITAYANFPKAWEVYELKRNKSKPVETTNRQKELSDRSMTRGETSITEPQGPRGFSQVRSWINRNS